MEPEILYDSTKYCTKNETRKAGPFYVDTDSYRQKMTPMTTKLRQWQTELLQEKEDVDMFTFDFTRTMDEETSMNDLFQVVEELKNGHIVSVLYGNPMEVAMTSPHVVIFTNEKFENYQKYLSKDRWMSYVITQDKALTARKWDTDMHQ